MNNDWVKLYEQGVQLEVLYSDGTWVTNRMHPDDWAGIRQFRVVCQHTWICKLRGTLNIC